MKKFLALSLFLLVLPAAAQGSGSGRVWEFDTPADLLPWELTSHLLFPTLSGGAFHTQVIGERGTIVQILPEPLSTADCPVATIRLKAGPVDGGEGLVSFFWSFSKGFNLDRSVGLPLLADGEWHTYSFALAEHPLWKGEVRVLCIEFTVPDAPVSVDYIRLGKSNEDQPRRKWEFVKGWQGWTWKDDAVPAGAGGLKSLVKPGEWEGPPNIHLPARQANLLLVDYRISASRPCTGKVYARVEGILKGKERVEESAVYGLNTGGDQVTLAMLLPWRGFDFVERITLSWDLNAPVTVGLERTEVLSRWQVLLRPRLLTHIGLMLVQLHPGKVAAKAAKWGGLAVMLLGGLAVLARFVRKMQSTPDAPLQERLFRWGLVLWLMFLPWLFAKEGKALKETWNDYGGMSAQERLARRLDGYAGYTDTGFLLEKLEGLLREGDTVAISAGERFKNQTFMLAYHLWPRKTIEVPLKEGGRLDQAKLKAVGAHVILCLDDKPPEKPVISAQKYRLTETATLFTLPREVAP